MLKESPNYKLALLGCVGNDTYGKKLKEILEEIDVEPLFEVHATKLTSRCGVGVFRKERCLLAEINASKYLSLDYVKSHMVNAS